MRRTSGHTTAVAAAFVVGALFGGGPPLAAAVFDANNADKVDGRHAIGPGASPSARAGKLVATNAAGRLPNTIIASAPNAARLDGRPATAHQRRVTGTCPSGKYIAAIGAGGGVTCRTDRINGGNAQTLDGSDPEDFEARGVRTTFVSPVGSATQNGAALRAAVDAIASSDVAPSATDPWLVDIEPGTFDLGSSPLVLPEFLRVRGAGRLTTITGDGAAAPPGNTEAASVLVMEDDTTVESVRVIQRDGPVNAFAHAIYMRGDKPTLRDAFLSATAPFPIALIAGSGLGTATLNRIEVSSVGVQGAVGVGLSAGTVVTLSDSRIEGMSAEGDYVVGLQISSPNSGVSKVVRSEITAEGGGDFARALWYQGGTTVIEDSELIAGGATVAKAALFQEPGAGHTVRVVHSMLDGPHLNSSNIVCVGAFNKNFAALNGGCS